MTDESDDAKDDKKKRKKKRGHGEGTIHQQANGTWLAAITLGTDSNGKRIRKYVRGKTKKQVTDKLTRLQNQKLDGTLIDTGKMTIADLMDRWMNESAKPSVAATTLQRYDVLVKKHIKPTIGQYTLSAFKPFHVQTMLNKLEENGAGDETRRYALQVLKRAFNVAIRWGLVIRNPCNMIDTPKVTRRDISPLTVDQVQKLLRVAEGFTDQDIVIDGVRNAAVFTLAITTGLRQGELFALHWSDIDLDKGTLAVRFSLEEVKGKLTLKEPKSKSGKRSVRLSAMAIEALWKQRADLMKDGLGACPIVFPDTDGQFLRKSNFERRTWKPCRKLAGIPETVVFHDLRHTSASLLLSAGTHPKVVQERLGHSEIGLTMDTYSHLMAGMQDVAATQMDNVLRAKIG